MAASTSTTDEVSDTIGNTAQDLPNAASGSSQTSAVPSIVLDDGSKTKAASLFRPRTRKRSSSSTLRTYDHSGVATAQPFQGIVTSIPSGEFEDPFATQEVKFSKRGSLLLQQTKRSGAHSRAQSSVNSMRNLAAVQQIDGSGQVQQRPLAAQVERLPEVVEPAERPMSASVADDRRASRRVRSWYGQEDALGESRQPQADVVSATPISEERDLVSELPEARPHGLSTPDDNLREERSANRLSSRSSRYYGSPAGGIEDWTNLDSRDVDRYGFYNARVVSSKRSSVVPSVVPSGRQSADQQRLRPSTAASPTTATNPQRPRSQQVPSRASSKRRSHRLSFNAGSKQQLRTSPSLTTARTTRSTSSRMARPFSRSSRLFEQAPMMLTTNGPSGLERSSASQDSPASLHQSSFPDAIVQDRTLECKRALKWARMATPISTNVSQKGGGTDFTFDTSNTKLISRTWKGIPDCWRAAAWYSFLATSATRASRSGTSQPSASDLETFFHHAQTLDCPDDIQIDMDVPRTVGSHVIFRQRYKGGQRFLFRVLRALSLYFPSTGYVQGMAAVVATLLNYYTEERAFVMAVRLWTLRGIGWLYKEGFEGLMTALADLDGKWMRGKTLETVRKQLETLGIHASAWGPKWYLTLFNYVLPFPAQLRVWDVFILLGETSQSPQTPASINKSPAATSSLAYPTTAPSPTAFPKPNLNPLHAVSAAMLHALSDAIIDADFENAMGVLTAPVPVGKEDFLMKVARRCWKEGPAGL